LCSELLGQLKAVLKLVSLLLLLTLLHLSGGFNLPVIHLVHHLVVYLLLVLWFIPVSRIILYTHLQVSINVGLLNPRLPSLDE